MKESFTRAKKGKYNNSWTTVDGIKFQSKGEAGCWKWLQSRVKAGEIQALSRQQSYELKVDGKLVCKYVADFVYLDSDLKTVVADYKGMVTDVYRLKKKLMKACHGIDLVELRLKDIPKCFRVT